MPSICPAPSEAYVTSSADGRTTWDPPLSPVAVVYPSGLPGDLQRRARRGDSRGLLYGVQQGNTIEIQAEGIEIQDKGIEIQDKGKLGSEKTVAIFVVRRRGEVFLSEGDLDFLERSGAPAALVIAGDRAGFFVWEQSDSPSRIPDRRIRSIQSYLEFPVRSPEAMRESRGDAARLWHNLSALFSRAKQPLRRPWQLQD